MVARIIVVEVDIMGEEVAAGKAGLTLVDTLAVKLLRVGIILRQCPTCNNNNVDCCLLP